MTRSPLFAAAMLIILLWPAMRGGLLSLLLIFSAALTIILFMSRGFLIQAVIQVLIFYMYRFKPRLTRSLILKALFFGACIVLFVGIWGDFRTGQPAFMSAMDIRDDMRQLPSSILWVDAYISLPLVNMIHLLRSFHSYDFGYFTVSTVTPPFLWHILSMRTPSELYQPIVLKYFPAHLNNMATYSAIPYIDFGWLGVVSFNLFLGVMIGYSNYKCVMQSNTFYQAINAILISCLILSFFWNLLINITIISEIILAYLVINIRLV
jgi:oligosaccharide repeat unit polymerase